jgi:hypothetical protein
VTVWEGVLGYALHTTGDLMVSRRAAGVVRPVADEAWVSCGSRRSRFRDAQPAVAGGFFLQTSCSQKSILTLPARVPAPV